MPADPASTIERADVWADASSGVVLRVDVIAKSTGKPALEQEFHWEGVPTAFTKDSFLLTMDTDTAKIEGLKVLPCTPTARRGSTTSR